MGVMSIHMCMCSVYTFMYFTSFIDNILNWVHVVFIEYNAELTINFIVYFVNVSLHDIYAYLCGCITPWYLCLMYGNPNGCKNINGQRTTLIIN